MQINAAEISELIKSKIQALPAAAEAFRRYCYLSNRRYLPRSRFG
jgi:hypothetical protein